MKVNTLSLSLLVSAALIVPTIAMADSADYSQDATAVDTMPAEGSLQQGSGEILTTQPSIDNGYETETITDNSTLNQDPMDQGTLNQNPMDQQGSQSNMEAYPPVTAPANTDYAAPAESEAPLTNDNF